MKPEDQLQDFLAQLEAGRSAADLAREHADLQSELEAAAALRRWTAPDLRPGAEARFRARLTRQQRAHPFQRVVMRWAAAGAVVLAVLAGGLGTAAASAHSLPGQPLYGLKRTLEAFQLALAAPAAQAALHTNRAQARLEEFVGLAGRGVWQPDLAAEAAAETGAALAALPASAAAQRTEVLERIIELAEEQQAVLTTVLEAAPAQARPGLERVLQASADHLAQAHGLLGAMPPVTLTATPSSLQTAAPSATAAAEASPSAIQSAPTAAAAQSTARTPPAGHPTSKPQRTPQGPACNANSSRSPNACPSSTAPSPTASTPDQVDQVMPTPCPTNPAGKQVCR